MPLAVLALPASLLPVMCAGVLLAQKTAADPAAVDPFTGGDPALLRAVGIEAVAPFPFADDHTTRDIEHELGYSVRLRWVETRHFKIGIAIGDRPWPIDKEEKKQLGDEIDALAATLPKLRPRPKVVSSWLLAHLYAQRLEALYADFCRRIGWKDAAEPCKDGKGTDGRGWAERGGLGNGPYLGQYGKFCFLLFEKKADLARYLRQFAKRELDHGAQHHFLGSNSLLYVTTPDIRSGGLSTERALHGDVVYGMVRNFVVGYRGFSYEIPVWTVEGTAHWYRRRLDPKYNSISQLAESQWGLLHEADWAGKARARAQTGAYAKAAAIVQWRIEDCTDFHKHVMMWSRIDFLLAQGDDKFGRYLHELKGLPTNGVAREAVLECQTRALQNAYGFDLDGFDRAWVEYAKSGRSGKPDKGDKSTKGENVRK
jgi:hypothetical protein